MLVPKIVEIEIARGLCSASCPMCPIDQTKYNKIIMSDGKFKLLVDNFGKNISRLDKVILCGIGEVLLDNTLHKKISYLKSKGVPWVAAPSNASLLFEKTSERLMSAGLNEVIIGVDSLNKNIFEKIRRDLIFEEVMENTLSHIKVRDKFDFNHKVHIRMIINEDNKHEWNDYKKFWSKHLNFDKGDMILYFPEHNWSSHEYENADGEPAEVKKTNTCSYVFDRINIDAHGNIKFCCIDINATFFNLGNALFEDPVKLFNSNFFKNSRKLMNQGKINSIKPCKNCNIPVQSEQRGFSNDQDIEVGDLPPEN